MRGATQRIMHASDTKKGLLSRPKASVLCVALFLTLTPVFVGCDEGSDITYVNMTDSTLEVYIDGLLDLTLEPNETRELLILKFSIPKLFQAQLKDRTVIFSETLSWEDLEAREFNLVFTDPPQ